MTATAASVDRCLCLSQGNNLSPSFIADKLSEFVARNTSLTALSLEWNDIGFPGPSARASVRA